MRIILSLLFLDIVKRDDIAHYFCMSHNWMKTIHEEIQLCVSYQFWVSKRFDTVNVKHPVITAWTHKPHGVNGQFEPKQMSFFGATVYWEDTRCLCLVCTATGFWTDSNKADTHWFLLLSLKASSGSSASRLRLQLRMVCRMLLTVASFSELCSPSAPALCRKCCCPL